MRELAFRIVNVFTVDGGRLTGNPLAVFEDGNGLSDDEMLGIARQLNLSETTFVLAKTAEGATARVRIFTPTLEMPFAGHPTLGTAQVVRELANAGDSIVLEMKAGLVHVEAREHRWTLRTARPPEAKPPSASIEALAAMIGLPPEAISAAPLWVDTGAEQLVVPVRSVADVLAARPIAALLETSGYGEKSREGMAYLWAIADTDTVVARFFFVSNGGVIEDPATGSACANLGGYLVATRHRLPVHWTVRQGDAVGRPSRLLLTVDADGQVFVGGEVIELGRGTLWV